MLCPNVVGVSLGTFGLKEMEFCTYSPSSISQNRSVFLVAHLEMFVYFIF